MNLDQESGQAFSDPKIFTKSHTLDFDSGKTADRAIPHVTTQDSPRTVSTGESPLEKRGVAIFFSRRESAVLGSLGYYYVVDVEVSFY